MKDYEKWGGRQSVPGTGDGPGDGRGAQGGTVEGPTGGTKSVPTLPLNLVSPQVRRVRKESSKESTKETDSLTLSQYLLEHTPEGQEIIRQIVQAIASIRRSNKVAGSVLDALAKKWSRYPQAAVLSGCRIYLDKNYASEGKSEAYLLGIIRQEAKRPNGRGQGLQAGQNEEKTPAPLPRPTQTPGQRLIERVMTETLREQEQLR